MRKLNLLALTIITASTFSLTAFAGSDEDKNICDVLIKKGATKTEIEMCFKEFGKSKFRKSIEKAARDRGEQEATNRTEAEESRAAADVERKKYIIKRFEGDELTYLYSQFVAVKYTDQEMGSDETVDKKMTSPKEMCAHLGFEDAVSDKEGIGYKLSERLQDYQNPDYLGMYVNWNGKKKQVKWDDDEPSAVKHYTKIVCKRLRKNDETAQSAEIQNAVRLINEANTQRASRSGDGEEQVDSNRNDESEYEIEVRELLERRSKKPRQYDRFTHEK